MSQENAITQNCYCTVKSYNWGGRGGLKLAREQQEIEKVIQSGNGFMIDKQMGFYQLTYRKVEKMLKLCFIFPLFPLLVFLNYSSSRPLFFKRNPNFTRNYLNLSQLVIFLSRQHRTELMPCGEPPGNSCNLV